MAKNIDALNDIYKNAQIGVVGISDVLYKVKNDKLKKELEKEKKNFENIMKRCEKYLKEYKCKPPKINLMTKISSEFYSGMKLSKDNSDDIIIKMMIESAYKSLGILTTKIMEYDVIEQRIKILAESLLENINNNISILKKFDKIC